MWGPDAQTAGLNVRWLIGRRRLAETWAGRWVGNEGAQSYTPGCDPTRPGSHRHDIGAQSGHQGKVSNRMTLQEIGHTPLSWHGSRISGGRVGYGSGALSEARFGPFVVGAGRRVLRGRR